MRANPSFPPLFHVLQARFHPAIMNNHLKICNFKNIKTIKKEEQWMGEILTLSKITFLKILCHRNIIPMNTFN